MLVALAALVQQCAFLNCICVDVCLTQLVTDFVQHTLWSGITG